MEFDRPDFFLTGTSKWSTDNVNDSSSINAGADNSSINGSSINGCQNGSPWSRTCYTVPIASLLIALATLLMILITFGNVLVIVAVFREPKLRRMRQNWLIVSLAAADVWVGCLIMPMTLTYEIFGEWIFGWIMCELWLALDVLFVTSSILNLCAISLDRYWSLTDPMQYPKKRTTTRMSSTILIVWFLALLISFPPLVGWRPLRDPGQCTLSQNVSYVLYSAFGSFYIPVIVLLIVYVRIFRIIHQRSKARMMEAQRRQTALTLTTVLGPLQVAHNGYKRRHRLSRLFATSCQQGESDTLFAVLPSTRSRTTQGHRDSATALTSIFNGGGGGSYDEIPGSPMRIPGRNRSSRIELVRGDYETFPENVPGHRKTFKLVKSLINLVNNNNDNNSNNESGDRSGVADRRKLGFNRGRSESYLVNEKSYLTMAPAVNNDRTTTIIDSTNNRCRWYSLGRTTKSEINNDDRAVNQNGSTSNNNNENNNIIYEEVSSLSTTNSTNNSNKTHHMHNNNNNSSIHPIITALVMNSTCNTNKSNHKEKSELFGTESESESKNRYNNHRTVTIVQNEPTTTVPKTRFLLQQKQQQRRTSNGTDLLLQKNVGIGGGRSGSRIITVNNSSDPDNLKRFPFTQRQQQQADRSSTDAAFRTRYKSSSSGIKEDISSSSSSSSEDAEEDFTVIKCGRNSSSSSKCRIAQEATSDRGSSINQQGSIEDKEGIDAANLHHRNRTETLNSILTASDDLQPQQQSTPTPLQTASLPRLMSTFGGVDEGAALVENEGETTNSGNNYGTRPGQANKYSRFSCLADVAKNQSNNNNNSAQFSNRREGSFQMQKFKTRVSAGSGRIRSNSHFVSGSINTTANPSAVVTDSYNNINNRVVAGGGGGRVKSASVCSSIDGSPHERLLAKQRLLKRKDRRATLSLSLILGSFIACWLPFFLLYLLSSVHVYVQETVFDVIFWLGYCNSALNPVIYTFMNHEFRAAFRKILRI